MDQNESGESQKEQKMLVPGAIILAGAIVAGAIIYVNSPRNQGGNTVLPPNGQEQLAGTGGAVPPLTDEAAKALKIRQNDFVLGNPAAKVVIIEYGDFQCPFCARFFKTTEQQIISEYVKTGKAAFLWRDFAFLGEESFRASEAARCAGEQGKFWEYHDHIFNNQKGENEGAFGDPVLKRFAKDLSLDTTKFDLCFTSGKYRKDVEASAAEGRMIGVNGTPATFVNTKLISGAVPFETFKNVIEEDLKK